MAHRHTKTEFIVSGCLGTFAGVAFTAGGVLLLWSTIAFLPGTVPTTGTIVSCVRIRTASCDPTVSFPLPSGQELTFQSAYASSSFSGRRDGASEVSSKDSTGCPYCFPGDLGIPTDNCWDWSAPAARWLVSFLA